VFIKNIIGKASSAQVLHQENPHQAFVDQDFDRGGYFTDGIVYILEELPFGPGDAGLIGETIELIIQVEVLDQFRRRGKDAGIDGQGLKCTPVADVSHPVVEWRWRRQLISSHRPQWIGGPLTQRMAARSQHR
jgi:hypothetical protein